MNDHYAVLLDTVSIQPYIFSSNQLRENLGASHLVKEIYRDYLIQAIRTTTGGTLDLNAWKEVESETFDCSDGVEIGYIGGGNALLFFQSEELARWFIKEWTKILLVRTPGLTTAVAYVSFPNEPQKFKESLKILFRQLEWNKGRHIPITALPQHGITTECARSGISAELYNRAVKNYVSAGTNAKIEAASSSKADLEERYRDELADRFCFPDQLEHLGGIRGEDTHIAIVHIDGNDIGDRFKGANTLKEIRQLSKTVHDATQVAFDTLVKTTIDQYKDIMQSLGFDPDSGDPKRRYPVMDGRKILPIRPIILGGDDVTFICDGKLGIYLTGIFIEAFEQGKASDGEKLTACAGIAIIPTKYPFYRGKMIADELCANAKRTRKGANQTWKGTSSPDSYLDFHISMAGVSGTLEAMRQLHFDAPQRQLLYRPFRILPKGQFDEYNLDLFLDKVRQLQINLPGNRINELREVLTLPEEAGSKFVQELEYRRMRLPEIEGRHYHETLFDNGLTPYFDMIEILRFYPEFALRADGENG